jgi:hypothetical protein
MTELLAGRRAGPATQFALRPDVPQTSATSPDRHSSAPGEMVLPGCRVALGRNSHSIPLSKKAAALVQRPALRRRCSAGRTLMYALELLVTFVDIKRPRQRTILRPIAPIGEPSSPNRLQGRDLTRPNREGRCSNHQPLGRAGSNPMFRGNCIWVSRHSGRRTPASTSPVETFQIDSAVAPLTRGVRSTYPALAGSNLIRRTELSAPSRRRANAGTGYPPFGDLSG